jgi:Heavy metal associated domain 2
VKPEKKLKLVEINMAAECFVAHTIPGRTRLRVPEMRKNYDYFEDIQRDLADCPGIESIETNSSTGSILIIHSCSVDELKQYLTNRGLVTFREENEKAISITDSVAHSIRKIDRQICSFTSNNVSSKEMIFSFLVLLSLYQMIKGSILPAASTLIWYGLNILEPLKKPAAE